MIRLVMGGLDAGGSATTVDPQVRKLLSDDPAVQPDKNGGYCAHNCIDEIGAMYVGMFGAAENGQYDEDVEQYDDDPLMSPYVDNESDSDSDITEIDDDNDIQLYIGADDDYDGDEPPQRIESRLRDDFINASLLAGKSQ